MPLTADEVEQLRRIHVLSQFGELPASMQSLLEELRARDGGAELGAPALDVRIVPRQRSRDDAVDNLIDYFAVDDDPDAVTEQVAAEQAVADDCVGDDEAENGGRSAVVYDLDRYLSGLGDCRRRRFG